MALAVDALARLSCGLRDGQPLDEEDASLLEDIVPVALSVSKRYVSEGGGGPVGSSEDVVALVRAAVASRGERANAYD